MTTSKVVIGEGQVTFKRTQGHVHDGLTSTLIDTSKYSIFDFTVAENGKDTSRKQSQENNVRMLKTFIIDTIEGRILKPEGIAIQANAITAREIVAGTITANELSSNIVLVNNIIRSSNFINNTTTKTGWAIYSNGNAIFNNVQIRGSLIAGDGYYAAANTALFANIGGYFSLKDKLTWDGSALTIRGTLQFPNGSTPGTFNNGDGLSAGSIGGITIGGSYIQSTDYDANNGFRINSDGSAIFNEVSVRGAITATSGSISGTVTIGSQTATAVSGAVTTASSAAAAAAAAQTTADGKIDGTQVNANVTSISGNTITTGTINLNNINVRTGTTGARLNIDVNGIFIYDANGTNTVALSSNGYASFSGQLSSATGSIGNNLFVGNNVRINGAAGDGAVSVVKIRADSQPSPSLSTSPGRNPLSVVSFLNNDAFVVRYDGRCDLGATSYVNGSVIQTSDKRYKKNIENSILGLDFVKKLKPISYYWENIEGNQSLGMHQGFIAQDVKEIKNSLEEEFGGWFLYDDNDIDSRQGLDYNQFIAPLVKAVQELSAKIESLEARIQTLEGV